jgi:8-oxo-dGTP pyrophosphatase MutT (NUDIX family)
MYKVFFQDRTVILTENVTKYIKQDYGLFYKFKNREELSDILMFFNKHIDIDGLVVFHNDLKTLWVEFKNCFLFIEAAGGLVKNRKGEVLIIKRRGKWDLPKGKTKKKETIEEAAIREVNEECGISDLKIKSTLYTTYHTYELEDQMILKGTRWFEMIHSGSGILRPEIREDITEAQWIKPDNLGPVFNNTYKTILEVLTDSCLK